MSFRMSSNSMEEDEPTFPMVLTKNNEDYMETCDDEINDIVPTFQRLNINDEPVELRSETMNEPCFSAETFPSLINRNEGTLMADSSVKVSPTFIGDICGNIWISEVTKVALGEEISLPATNEIIQTIPANIQVDSQSQNVVLKTSAEVTIHTHSINQEDEQKLDESKEMEDTGTENVLDESPMNLCLVDKWDHSYAVVPISTVSERKSDLLYSIASPNKTKQVYSDSGEVSYTSNVILPEIRISDRIDDDSKGLVLEQSNTIVDLDSSKLSYSADVSSDDQSYMNSGVTIDSSPDPHDSSAVNKASVQAKRHRKFATFVPPATQLNRNRQRRFSIFLPPSSNIVETETSSANSTSDEDSKTSSAIGKVTPISSKRKCRKAKSSSTSKFLIPPDVKSDEEKLPSPCKRKKTSTENGVGTTGKFRKRSISEHISETGVKTNLSIRSRSLSSVLKVTNQSVEISPVRKSRKRTSSDFENVGRAKSRKSSGSSDDAENK